MTVRSRSCDFVSHAARASLRVALAAVLVFTAGVARAADSPYGQATPGDAAEQLLDFAESSFPQFFPTREATQSVAKLRYRHYPSMGTYIAVAINVAPGDGLVEGGVYVLGGAAGTSPILVGVLNQFITPVSSPLVNITLNLRASAPQWPGPVYLRMGDGPVTRADITRQDANCSPSGPGDYSCTIRVRRGQTVTLVANDQQAQIQLFSKPYVATRDADPRGIRSQFDAFGAPCTATAERGVCAITASGDRTIEVNYTPLKLTRIKFLGLVAWDVTVIAPPNLNVGSDRQTEDQVMIASKQGGLGTCFTGDTPVTCYDIISSSAATFRFEALTPVGPTPLGSSGPLRFIGYDNACGSLPVCNLEGGVDEVVTMKWQYYRCPTGASNPLWNYGSPSFGNCVVVTPS